MTKSSPSPLDTKTHAAARHSGDAGRVSSLTVPPIIWALHFVVLYVAAALVCAGESAEITAWLRVFTISISIIALIMLALVTVLVWRKRPAPGDELMAQHVQNRFLSRMTLALSILAAVAIVVQASPVWLAGSCL